MCRQGCKPLIIIFYSFIITSAFITGLVMCFDFIYPTHLYNMKEIGRFSFHEFFFNLDGVCYLGIFLTVGASMLQLGHSFDLIFFNKSKQKIKLKQRIASAVFVIFMIATLSLLLVIPFTYNTHEKYTDQVVICAVKLFLNLTAAIVNSIILIWLHTKLRSYKSDKIRVQMRKVKLHFFLINLSFIILVIIDGFRLYAAI